MNRIVISEINYKNRDFVVFIEMDGNRIYQKFFIYPKDQKSLVGNVYIARVDKVVKGIEAAFVKIAKDITCYLSLRDAKNPVYTCKKSKKPELCEGDEILVQVTKDAVKTKDPIVSTNISISTKYCISTTNNKTKSISRKISSERANEIKNIVDVVLEKSNYKDDFGIVVRTAAQEIDNTVLESDLKNNIRQIEEILSRCIHLNMYEQLYEAEELYISKLKGLNFEKIECILTDNHRIYDELKKYFPDLAACEKLCLYKDDYPLRLLYQFESNLSKMTSKQVWLPSGGNIIFEQLETLTFIDVNSSKGSASKESVVLKTNKEAAFEIARQLKLRNISGMIIVDFINMKSDDIQTELITYLKTLLTKDDVLCQYVDMTKLGLVEITRKKVYKSLKEILK